MTPQAPKRTSFSPHVSKLFERNEAIFVRNLKFFGESYLLNENNLFPAEVLAIFNGKLVMRQRQHSAAN